MKKILAAWLVLSGSVALASPALADDPPPVPVTAGSHSLVEPGKKPFPVTVKLDCGAACFSFIDASERDEFRWVGDKWLAQGSGVWTVDGVMFTNRNGFTAALS